MCVFICSRNMATEVCRRSSSKRRLLVALQMTILMTFCIVEGMEDMYSNIHISPNSKRFQVHDKNYISSDKVVITPTLVPNIRERNEIHEADKTVLENGDEMQTDSEHHVIVVRSASPILRKTGHQHTNDLHAYASKDAENVDSNDVDVKTGKYFHLSPTRTLNIDDSRNILVTSSHKSGEGMRAPRDGKALPSLEPRNSTSYSPAMNTTTSKDSATEVGRARQANPDIQDIITGIVKLLNGNVNVQANASPTHAGRPVRPVSTRINNRGPPRISDIPPLPPDFDAPISHNTNMNSGAAPSSNVLPPPPAGQMSPPAPATSMYPTKLPPPYPFDLPVPTNSPLPIRPFLNGVPLPEQLVPLGSVSHRPPFHSGRPSNIPPWQRRPRPPQRRPPILNIPPYKPIPPVDINVDTGDEISFTSLEPLDSATQENSSADDVPDDFEESVPIPITESSMDINMNVGQTEATYHNLSDFIESLSNSNGSTEKETVTELIPDPIPTFVEIINKEDHIKDTVPEKKPIKDKDKHYIKSDKLQPDNNKETSSQIVTIDSSKVVQNSELTKQTIIPDKSVSVDHTKEMKPDSTNTDSSSLTSASNDQGSENNKESILTEIHGIGEAIPVLETSIKDIETMVSKIEAQESSLNNQATPTEGLSIAPTKTLSTTNGSQTSIINTQPPITESSTLTSFPYYPYRPRPGIVLDDTEYKPGGHHHRHPPIITARPAHVNGDIFDVTVSAIQGPGESSNSGGTTPQGKPFVIPVDMDGVHVGVTNLGDVITSPSGSEGFVSIDGKRTYLNLFGDATPVIAGTASTSHNIQPTKIKPTSSTSGSTVHVTGTGYAVPQEVLPGLGSGIAASRPNAATKPTAARRPVFGKRPQPPVRIDTCIVGDDSTCDGSQFEVCRTDGGVSACVCRAGRARRISREPCRRALAIVAALRVDRMHNRRINWIGAFTDSGSDEYRQLAFEATHAIDSAMSMTPFSDDFVEARVNNIYRSEGGVFVNMTLLLDEDGVATTRNSLTSEVRRHLLGAISRRGNNIGNSALWVDAPTGAVSPLQDLDECANSELNDCDEEATCTNVFGGFTCMCRPGTRDPWANNRARAGRTCDTCPTAYCNNRGTCSYDAVGQQLCTCQGNYYGSQCEVDGEVLGVAVGASVAAIIIILLTLVCLVMWSRKWNREQKAAAVGGTGLGGLGSPVFGYMATGVGGTVKTPAVGPPPYQLTLEDRMRWAHLADVMAQANHYAPEPVGMQGTMGGTTTRPSSAIFAGYPSLSMHGGTLHGGTMNPPVPLPRLGLQMARAASVHAFSLKGGGTTTVDSSSSEEEDRADLLGRNFQVPRPKSRNSIANQSGIYYDVDYDQSDLYKHSGIGGGIPMSTYTPGRSPYYKN